MSEKCIHPVGFHHLGGPFDTKEKRCPLCGDRESTPEVLLEEGEG